LLRNKIERDLWSGGNLDETEQDLEEEKRAAQLERYQKQDRQYHQTELRLLENLVALVRKEITNNTLTVDNLAHRMALSKRQLYRKCKELTGLTPAQLMREIRLQEARALLEDEHVTTVNELIHEVGFQNSGYFSKLYEERFGRRPSDYI
jgi:transcriptional regulator GlxA family with amidase domain